MVIKKITGKTMFKPSFGGKKGTTDFYQAFIDDERVGEIEVKPISVYNGKPEILSLYSDIRESGVGKFLVKEILKIYMDDEVYVMTTKESKPFWLKMGAVEINNYLCIFKKGLYIKSFNDF